MFGSGTTNTKSLPKKRYATSSTRIADKFSPSNPTFEPSARIAACNSSVPQSERFDSSAKLIPISYGLNIAIVAFCVITLATSSAADP